MVLCTLQCCNRSCHTPCQGNHHLKRDAFVPNGGFPHVTCAGYGFKFISQLLHCLKHLVLQANLGACCLTWSSYLSAKTCPL